MYSLIFQGRRKSLELLSLQIASSYANSFSSASSATRVSLEDGRKGKNFTVSYLVDSLGFTTKLAESISRKVSSEGKADPDSVLSLLRSYGFTDSHISDIVRTYPRLLIADAEKSLAPKLEFLQSRGASTSELTEILSKVPKILGLRWHKAIGTHYDFVKEIIEADKGSKYEMSCKSSLSPQANKLRNVSALRELGVPQRFLFSLLISEGKPVCGKEKFEESLKKVLEMGFNPTTSNFVEALCIVYGLSERAIEAKVSVYKELGFAVGDVWGMFKKNPRFLAHSEKNISKFVEKFTGLGFTKDEFVTMAKRFPQCIGLSQETLRKKTEFLVKEMNWPLKDLASSPVVLGYSLEKKIVPRCNVIKTLMSKGLLGSELPAMSYVLSLPDQMFLKRYVKKHDEKAARA